MASDSYGHPAVNTNPSYNQLLSFSGQSIVYDACGNPTTYRGKTLVWEGRRLVGDGERTYVYKADGTRIKKGSTVYKTAGSRVLTEEATNYTMSFFYDDNGVSGFLYNGTACYHYVKNLQGDIVALLDNSGAVVAKYLYDPWGVPTVTYPGGTVITNPEHIGNLNPFRYRGYYYDKETGWYYLQSRYYDPTLRRFLNADVMDVLTVDPMGFVGKNLFAYCDNNPVNLSDETGALPSWATKLIVAAAIVAVVAAVAVITVVTAGTGTAAAVIAVGAAKGAAIGMASGAAIGAATGAVTHRISTGGWDGVDAAVLDGMSNGALSGAITGAISGGVGSAFKIRSAASAWDSSSKGEPWANMSAHYKKHVLLEGKTTRTRNVITYTNDALELWNQNNGMGKLMSSGSLRLKGLGVGGFYSKAGLIRSFFYQ